MPTHSISSQLNNSLNPSAPVDVISRQCGYDTRAGDVICRPRPRAQMSENRPGASVFYTLRPAEKNSARCEAGVSLQNPRRPVHLG